MKETIKTTEIFLSLSLFLNHKTLHLWKSNIFWGNLQPSSGLPARKLGVTSSALLATWVKRIPTHKPRPPDILHPMPGDIQPQPKPELVSLGDSWGKKSVKQIIHPPTPRSASVTIVEVKWFSYTHEDIKKPTWIICLVSYWVLWWNNRTNRFAKIYKETPAKSPRASKIQPWTIEHRLNMRSSPIHQSSEKINKPPGNGTK